MLLIMAGLAVLTSILVVYAEKRRTPIPDVFRDAFAGDGGSSGS